jgi:hypothetical protein
MQMPFYVQVATPMQKEGSNSWMTELSLPVGVIVAQQQPTDLPPSPVLAEDWLTSHSNNCVMSVGLPCHVMSVGLPCHVMSVGLPCHGAIVTEPVFLSMAVPAAPLQPGSDYYFRFLVDDPHSLAPHVAVSDRYDVAEVLNTKGDKVPCNKVTSQTPEFPPPPLAGCWCLDLQPI